MQNPLVALIIPIYNVKDYLKECLDSVLNQTYQNLQIILVDDASNDGSFEITKEYFQKDLRVTLVRSKKNGGMGVSRNLGLDYLLSKQALEKTYIGEDFKDQTLEMDFKANASRVQNSLFSTSSGGGGGQRIEKIAS